jgi:hypothetical protein
MRRKKRKHCVSGAAGDSNFAASSAGRGSNITRYGHALAMVVPKHRARPGMGRRGDADEKIDPEVERARSRGTERFCSR